MVPTVEWTALFHISFELEIVRKMLSKHII